MSLLLQLNPIGSNGEIGSPTIGIFLRICSFLDMASLTQLEIYCQRNHEDEHGWDFMLETEKSKRLQDVL